MQWCICSEALDAEFLKWVADDNVSTIPAFKNRPPERTLDLGCGVCPIHRVFTLLLIIWYDHLRVAVGSLMLPRNGRNANS